MSRADRDGLTLRYSPSTRGGGGRICCFSSRCLYIDLDMFSQYDFIVIKDNPLVSLRKIVAMKRGSYKKAISTLAYDSSLDNTLMIHARTINSDVL